MQLVSGGNVLIEAGQNIDASVKYLDTDGDVRCTFRPSLGTL